MSLDRLPISALVKTGWFRRASSDVKSSMSEQMLDAIMRIETSSIPSGMQIYNFSNLWKATKNQVKDGWGSTSRETETEHLPVTPPKNIPTQIKPKKKLCSHKSWILRTASIPIEATTSYRWAHRTQLLQAPVQVWFPRSQSTACRSFYGLQMALVEGQVLNQSFSTSMFPWPIEWLTDRRMASWTSNLETLKSQYFFHEHAWWPVKGSTTHNGSVLLKSCNPRISVPSTSQVYYLWKVDRRPRPP